MDREVLAAAMTGADTVLARIHTAVDDLETALRTLRQRVGVSESLHGHASRLRAMLAIELRRIVDDLRRQAEESAEDTEFVETLERTFDETLEWIQDGFGVGAEAWTSRAFEDMAKLGNASAFAVDELNFIRVDISRRFAELSDLFAGRVQAVWGQVADALRRRLGNLLPESESPDLVLRRFVELLNDAEEPCPTLATAVAGLLEVRIDYQSQLYPRVRAALAGLNQEVRNPSTGEIVHQTAVEISEAGAEQLYLLTSRLAERAAHQAKRALLAESIAPTMILTRSPSTSPTTSSGPASRRASSAAWPAPTATTSGRPSSTRSARRTPGSPGCGPPSARSPRPSQNWRRACGRTTVR